VDPRRDFAAVFPLSDLQAGTRYELEVEARKGSSATVSSTVKGGFVTAPAATSSAEVTFCVMTCQQYEDRDRPDGFTLYPSMLRLQPDFFVNTGDTVYYDHGPVHALNLDLARYHWARMFSYPTLREFHRQVGSYFMRDDHDTLTDDSHPGDRSGDLTFEDGLRVFREQTAQGQPPYRTVRWGRHLQIWLLEGRETRSTRAADRTNTPTILGRKQIAWLEDTLAESDATFRIVITPTPIVGPDRDTKKDNLANARYAAEGAKIRDLFGRQTNMTVITGDRHWQYVTRDQARGIEEWSVGAASDEHAGGWEEDEPRPQHLFLRTKHGGFLSGILKARDASTTLTLQLRDVNGAVVFEKTKSAAE
jgi:alkaline phosphatase D